MTEPTTADVTAFLRSRISERTRVPENEFRSDTVLVDIGLESVDAVLICGEIEDAYDIEVEPSMMFELPTMGLVVDAVTALIARR
jgi:acyl carrier protein